MKISEQNNVKLLSRSSTSAARYQKATGMIWIKKYLTSRRDLRGLVPCSLELFSGIAAWPVAFSALINDSSPSALSTLFSNSKLFPLPTKASSLVVTVSKRDTKASKGPSIFLFALTRQHDFRVYFQRKSTRSTNNAHSCISLYGSLNSKQNFIISRNI